jgi:nucleotide-binding universal stress UspA family protein
MGVSGVIVVGVDGSETSHEALRWAAQEARLRSARLVAVYAWSFVAPQPIGDPGMLAVPAGDLPGQLDAESDAAQDALDDAVEAVLGTEPGIEVERKLVERDAGEALVAESAKADLVVVGSHGRSGFRAALLGSVSRHVVDHSKCPVVVVKQQT